MVNLTRLEDVFSLSEELSPDHVLCPVKLIYLPSVVETAHKAKNQNRVLIELGKFHSAALSHGFRGRSFGGKNGVVYLNESDVDLCQTAQALLDQNNDILKKMGVNTDSLLPVKIVAHVKNGNRLVGAIDRSSSPYTVYVLGLSNYSGRVT